MSWKLCAYVLLVASLLCGLSWAQGIGTSGSITGDVKDPNGAVLAGATVTATNLEKGTKQSVQADSNGHYEIPGLAPAAYSVSAEQKGLQTLVQKNVVVNVGQTVTLDFRMKVSGVAESVEVTSAPPSIDTQQGGQENVITQQYVEDLPINRRDYLTFTLLAPGISNSTQLASNQDFRVQQTPQSGLSLYGSNGRGNSVTVDGGEANDEAGGVRLNLGQDAVREFEINRSNYNADLGSASGANINIVSKSGGNSIHGGIFGFFRSDAMDARNPFSFIPALAPGQPFNPANPDSVATPVKDSLSRQQFGASMGGPIRKNKTFYYLSAEGLRQNAQDSVPLLTNTSIFRPQALSTNNQVAIINGLATLPGNPAVPCLTGQPALPAAVCAGILQNILTVNPATSPLSAYLVNQFEANGGLFPFVTREYFLSGRLDHQFNQTNQAYLRYSFAHDNEQNPSVQALTGITRGSSIHTWDSTAQGGWLHQFGANTNNELRLQYNYNVFDVFSNSPARVGLDIAGFGSFGSNIFLPSLTINRRYEAADDIGMIRGKHNLKFGIYELMRGNSTQSHTFFPGRFQFGPLPGGILSPCLQVPAACGLNANPAVIDSLQSASLGLPQFYQQGFGSPQYSYWRPWTAMYFQDSWKIVPNFNLTFGLRYELDTNYGNLNTDKNNFAPRVSFAWDPFNDHKTVVRAGYGVFYSPIYGQIGNVVQTLGIVNGFQQIAQVFVPLTGAPGHPGLTSASIFQTLFAQGTIQCSTATAGNAACIIPGPPPGPQCTGAAAVGTLCQFGIAVTHGALAPLSVVFGGQPGYRNPYSQQGSFGIQHDFGRGLTANLTYTYVHTIGLPVALDANALPTAPITNGISAVNGQPVPFRNWAAPQCGANPLLCFANPLILQNNIYSSAGSAVYHGGILEVQKRMGERLTLMGSYTYSKAIDTNTDYNSDFAPMDATNLGADRALSDFDQRHKVVVAGILSSPWKDGDSSLNAGQRILANFQLAPILTYNSGHPFNILAGADVNGDRHSTNDRPLGVGRNAGQGPDFVNFDLRLSRSVKLGEKAGLNFTAEAFNLFNRTNFSSVDNFNQGTSVSSFQGSVIDPRVTPLGQGEFPFASASPRRQLQFGARLTF
jgi:hypothetical protein